MLPRPNATSSAPSRTVPQFGLEKDKSEPIVEKGDVAIIAGKPFVRSVSAKRKRLEEQTPAGGSISS